MHPQLRVELVNGLAWTPLVLLEDSFQIVSAENVDDLTCEPIHDAVGTLLDSLCVDKAVLLCRSTADGFDPFEMVRLRLYRLVEAVAFLICEEKTVRNTVEGD